MIARALRSDRPGEVLVEHQAEMDLAARLAALDHRREDLLHHADVATEALERLDVVVRRLLGGLLHRHWTALVRRSARSAPAGSEDASGSPGYRRFRGAAHRVR
jgi:hypothetical protein